MRDEGPSPEDLDRFSGETGYCPECGAEVWDEATHCPECGEVIAGGTMSHPPFAEWFRGRWVALIAILVVIAFLLWML